MDTPTKLLLRPDEASEALGLCRSQVYQMLRTGELPSVRIGRAVRVPVAELKTWIAERMTAA